MGRDEDDFDHVTDRAGHDLRYAIESEQAPDRARLAAPLRRLRRGAGPDHRLVPRPRRLVASAQGGDRGRVRRPGPVTMTRLPSIEGTAIPGLLVLRMAVHQDNRGWFKENWQREVMGELGLPEGFSPVQHNLAYNTRRGTTRGIHAEPWDKLVSVATGRAFGAWVDLREGDTFGTTVHVDLDPSVAVFVPRGVGNAYQTLDDDTVYSYLVTRHWSPEARYAAVDLADPTVAVPWPIPLDDADRQRQGPLPTRAARRGTHAPPTRADHGGGWAARHRAGDGYPGRHLRDRRRARHRRRGSRRGLAVDRLRRGPEHRRLDRRRRSRDPRTAGRQAWRGERRGAGPPGSRGVTARPGPASTTPPTTCSTAHGPSTPRTSPSARWASTGRARRPATSPCPSAPQRYLIRTSWVVGERPQLRPHHGAARRRGRLARRWSTTRSVGSRSPTSSPAPPVHLLDTRAPYGTYNCTNAGAPTSWADVARQVFEQCGRSADDVTPRLHGRVRRGQGRWPPRPASSVLDLTKLEGTGFRPEDATSALRRYRRAPAGR